MEMTVSNETVSATAQRYSIAEQLVSKWAMPDVLVKARGLHFKADGL